MLQRIKKWIWKVTGAQSALDRTQEKLNELQEEVTFLRERDKNPSKRKTSNQCGACKYGWLSDVGFGIVSYSCLKEPVCPDFDGKYTPKNEG